MDFNMKELDPFEPDEESDDEDDNNKQGGDPADESDDDDWSEPVECTIFISRVRTVIRQSTVCLTVCLDSPTEAH